MGQYGTHQRYNEVNKNLIFPKFLTLVTQNAPTTQTLWLLSWVEVFPYCSAIGPVKIHSHFQIFKLTNFQILLFGIFQFANLLL